MFEPGSRVKYVSWRTHDSREGIVKKWGRKWVEVVRDDGKIDWGTPDTCELLSAPNSTVNDPPSTEQAAPAQGQQQEPAENQSPFSYLVPGSMVQFNYCADPKEKQGGGIGGNYHGYFVKYDKPYHLVSIRTIPPYHGAPRVISIKEHLVTPLYEQPRIDLVTG